MRQTLFADWVQEVSLRNIDILNVLVGRFYMCSKHPANEVFISTQLCDQLIFVTKISYF